MSLVLQSAYRMCSHEWQYVVFCSVIKEVNSSLLRTKTHHEQRTTNFKPPANYFQISDHASRDPRCTFPKYSPSRHRLLRQQVRYFMLWKRKMQYLLLQLQRGYELTFLYSHRTTLSLFQYLLILFSKIQYPC